MESKTKVAGPLAAAGAVSLGLVLIGACGVGQEDTYVPPPVIHSGPQAAEPAQYTGEPSTSVARVLIPPSPTWRMAPEPPPRRTLPPEYQISVTASTDPGAQPTAGETTRRVTLSATPDPSTPAEPGWTTASMPSPPIEPAHTESPIPAPPSTSVVIAPAPAEAGDPPPAAPPAPAAAAEPPVPAEPPAAEPPAEAVEQASPETGTAAGTSTEPSPTQLPDASPAPRAAVATTEPTAPDATAESSPAVPVPTITLLPGGRIR